MQEGMLKDRHVQDLFTHIIGGWPHTKVQLTEDLKPYWSFKDNLAVIDWVVIKCQRIIIPQSSQEITLTQLHLRPMVILKTRLLAKEFVFWTGINSATENLIKDVPVCLEFPKN